MPRLIPLSLLLTTLVSTGEGQVADFGVSGSVPYVDLVPGQPAQFTITIQSVNGFAGQLNLSLVPGLPPYLSVSFPSVVSLTANGTSTAQVVATAISQIPALTYDQAIPLAIRISSGPNTKQVAVTLFLYRIYFFPSLRVPGPPVTVGNSVTYPLTVDSLHGFSSPVSVSILGLPVGISYSLSSSQVTPPPNGMGAAPLVLTAAPTMTPGRYNFTIRASSPLVAEFVDLSTSIVVNPLRPDFLLSTNTTSLNIQPGGTTTFQLNFQSLDLFAGVVDLSTSVPPSGVAVAFSPVQVTAWPAGRASVSVMVTAGNVPVSANITVIATAPTISVSRQIAVAVTVVVPSFRLTVSPGRVQAMPGQPATFAVTITGESGFVGPVSLGVTGLSLPGTVAVFSPPTVAPMMSTAALSTLTVTPPSSALPGTYSFAVSGTSPGTPSAQATAVLVVEPAPGITLVVSPAAIAAKEGQESQATVTAASIAGFFGKLSLEVQAPDRLLPFLALVSSTFDVPAGGTVSTVLNLSSSAPVGEYVVIIRAVAGTIQKDATINVRISAAPSLRLSSSPLTLSLVPGQTDVVSVTVTSENGFEGFVTLTVLGLPSALQDGSFSINPLRVQAGSSGASTLVLRATDSASVGVYQVALRAVAPSVLPKDITVTVVVRLGTPPPSFNGRGVVNAASFLAGLSRGSIGSLFGTSLADSLVQASTTPLPTLLAGARLTIGGIDAPLFSVSPGQINFQVPLELPLRGSVPLVVNRGGINSPAVTIDLEEYAPGIFTYAPEPGSVAPIVTRGNGALITAADPAQAGDVLVIYGTGIGNLTATVVTGAASPTPPAEAAVRPEIELGGIPLTVDFAGLTPGSIGLAQFNVRMPDSLPEGASELPLLIRFGGRSSQTVRLPVRGGAPPR